MRDEINKEVERRELIKEEKTRIEKLVEEEKLRRLLKRVPDELLYKVAKLSEGEFEKLGNPPVISNGSGGWMCNCKDGGDLVGDAYNIDCRRCGGYSY